MAIDQYPDLEIVCVECTMCKDIRTLIVCCYRPPNSSQKWFVSFKEFLDWADRLYDKIIITGDFNFPRISWSENAVIPSREHENLFYNTLSDLYFSQLIYIPTREQNILNLLITNFPDSIAIFLRIQLVLRSQLRTFLLQHGKSNNFSENKKNNL